MSDHALSRAAPKCIQNPMSTCRGHGNEVDVKFDRSVDDCFWNIAGSKNHSLERRSVHGSNPHRGLRTPDMEKMQGITCTPDQKFRYALDGLDGLQGWR